MKNELMLHEEIESELEELGKLGVGSDEYKVAVDGITKLMDRAIKIDELNANAQDKVESREAEYDFKQKQMNAEKKDRIVKNIITGFSIGIPAAVAIWGTIVTLKFDEVGTVTSIAGKEHTRKIFNLFRK